MLFGYNFRTALVNIDRMIQHIQRHFKTTALLSLFFALGFLGQSQSVTRVKGQVFDAQTKETLPFVNISFKGTNVGTSTDLDGKFAIQTRFPSDTLVIDYIGYETQALFIPQGERTKLDIFLEQETLQLQEVTIAAEKQKYSKKNNPSLELAKKVLRNRDQNRLRGQEYYSYRQHEKVRADINNITEKFKDRRMVRQFDFLFDYIDTSQINGRTFLPIFMRETLSDLYYQRSSNTVKEYRRAQKITTLDENNEFTSLNNLIDLMYQDIDIYENKVNLLDLQFVSPLSSNGEDFYRYYIQDTIEFKGDSVIDLAFFPADKADLGFRGNLYISNDERYTVIRAELHTIKDINVNWVRDLSIVQEYEMQDSVFIKTKDELVIDYSLTQNGIGFFGTRTVDYSNFDFNKPEDLSIFRGIENVIDAPDLAKDDSYWSNNRIESLNKNEQDLYSMMDTLSNNRKFKRYVKWSEFLTTGYWKMGAFELGPYATFLSFNSTEGFLLRLGGGTTDLFHNKIKLEGYGSYSFKAQRWKYYGSFLYSFNDKWKSNPRHYIKLTGERTSIFPGLEVEGVSPENFLLSFQRGESTRLLLNERYQLDYRKEIPGFAYSLALIHKQRKPLGTLSFPRLNPDTMEEELLSDITTMEVGVGFRFAPNEQFLQGKNYRTQLYNEYPIISVKYIAGLSDVLDGQYDYHKLYLRVFKRAKWVEIGTTSILLEGGKTFGKDIPYLLQFVARANQTYSHEFSSFNMMNFLEFVSDQYVSLQMEHHFKGYFLNSIPTIRKLKLRELITFKVIYGGLSDANNPNLNPHLVQFTKDKNGNPTTYTFGDTPYIEGSIGFSKIFKVLRVDLVRRFTHLNHVNVPTLFGHKGWGLRVQSSVEF